MKSLLVGTGSYLFKMYNYHDSRACSYKWTRILSRVDGLGVEWFGFGLCNTHFLHNKIIAKLEVQ
jgi:hypothetical protein